MSENNENKNFNNSLMEKKFFVNGRFHWRKSENEVWSEMTEKLNNTDIKKVKKLHFSPTMISIAASVVVIVGVVSFLRFYSTAVYTSSGIHNTAYLPDGSLVHLNAESELTYYPFWWKFKRIIKFEGEGFFEVQKGNKFKVHTQYGDVEVLGTSFNVFARQEATKITCVTGKVKVTSKEKEHVILTPNMKAEIFTDKQIKITTNNISDYDIAWRNNNFRFESVPLKNVFLEIERQYGINIELDFSALAIYSGNFYKEDNVENILNYVCSAMGLTFKKKSDKEYIILQE